MAAIAALQPAGPIGLEALAGQAEAEFVPHPRIPGGFLLEREDGSTVTAEVRKVDEDIRRGVTSQVDAYRITTDSAGGNGKRTQTTYSYNARTNEPRVLGSDLIVESTTAWTTRGGGINAGMMDDLNDRDYATFFVVPEGSAISASLIDSAVNLNYIGQIARRHRLRNGQIRPDQALYEGPSRAGAIGLGAEAVYVDSIAPCFFRPGKTTELPKDALQLALEVLELGKHIGRLGLDGAREHRETFSAHPVVALHSLLAIPQLRSGDTGKLFWSRSAGFTNITLFDRDGWSQVEEISRIAADTEDVHTEILDGRHLTLAHPAVRQAVLDRFALIAEMRGVDGRIEDVDFQQVVKVQPELAQRTGGLGSFSLGRTLKAAYNLASIS